MDLSAKIYVAGHQGLVGSAVLRRLRASGYTNLIVRTHQELDLTQQQAVSEFFETERPEYVFLAAAKVGGILANSTFPAEFIYKNLLIQSCVLDQSYRTAVKRLLFLGSSCIYPRHAPQPMKEEYLLTGPLEPTNRPYAIAKIAGIEMCWSYNRQFRTCFIVAMPANLYGLNDHYDLSTSHVLPALMRKMHEAKLSGAERVTVWGTGAPRREFLYSDDAADACIFVMRLPEQKLQSITQNNELPPILNVGCGDDLTIRELSNLMADVTGFKKKLVFDDTKPDGVPRKLLDVSRLRSLGWVARTELRTGLIHTYKDFREQHYGVSGVSPHSVSVY